MAKFELAIPLTLEFEGGYTNDPADPGGATNFGITQADMPGVDMRTITVQQATAYYQEHYWKPLYNEIDSQAVANKLFDMGVNMGVGTAVRLLQTALAVAIDGVFGPGTLAAANNAGDSLLAPYKVVLAKHYQNIVAAHPERVKFLAGWLRRANS